MAEAEEKAKMKWNSLFKECKDEIIGQCYSMAPVLSVWDNIERSIKMKRSSHIQTYHSRKVREEQPVFIAERGEVNCDDFNEIQKFLKKVCLHLPGVVNTFSKIVCVESINFCL